jgi:hypothetical protein
LSKLGNYWRWFQIGDFRICPTAKIKVWDNFKPLLCIFDSKKSNKMNFTGDGGRSHKISTHRGFRGFGSLENKLYKKRLTKIQILRFFCNYDLMEILIKINSTFFKKKITNLIFRK